MNKRLRNNALLNLAKSVHATVANLAIFMIMTVAISSNHMTLAFIILLLFMLIWGIVVAEIAFFVGNMIKANKE